MDNPISKRIAEIIEVKTGGNRVMFAEQIGVSKQRLNNVLAGTSVGLTIVSDVLAAYTDVNARWLIFGTGNMLELTSAQFGARYNLIKSFEQYLPVMSASEVAQLTAGRKDWSKEDVLRWNTLNLLRQQNIENHFAEAYDKQRENTPKPANNPRTAQGTNVTA